ncbi:MAG TPA: S8 family peptidase [Chitinophagaceae bacterium]|nr:S8 family peptidase [Chitinophagaceae bacterium]
MKTTGWGRWHTYIRGFTIVLLSVFITHCTFGQLNDNPRLSPGLLNQIRSTKIKEKLLLEVTIKNDKIPAEIYKPVYRAQKIFESSTFSVYRLFATPDEINSALLPLPGIIFIEKGARMAKEEIQVGNLDLSVNKINLAHRNFPLINGNGTTVSVKENKPDTTDIDFRGRFLSTNLSPTTVNSHASIMSTMIAGGGNSWHLGKGAAWGSTISSSSFAVLLPDANSAYLQYNISVQNHSYGVGVESYYGADAAAYDASAIANGSLLHIFSSGNSGTSAATTGTYSGLNGFANLTGSFKMAKNILTVGATDSFSVVAALSSKGPAHDGRVKPELVAFGEDGSSGAAALVSGSSLLLQHLYKQSNGTLPPNSLVKAILINSADDVGNAEVDYKNGFGSLNANNALNTLQANRFFAGSVSNSSNQSFTITVPAGIKKLKATLVWNDPPAAPNASRALINDLDLELKEISSGQTWQPWVLNPFPHVDSLVQLAKRKRDTLNNIEQITIDTPPAGNYQLKVTGFNVTTASQNFHIAWQLDSVDKFEWQFPTANDFIFPSTNNTIRWKSSFANANGILEYSTGGSSWQPIQNSVDLNSAYYNWNVPPVTSIGLVRMTIGSNVFISDTFTIANRTTTGVGFNCPDSFLFYWNKLPGIANYKVYKLGNKYLEPITVTTDSFMLLAKAANPSLHYAVAPIIGSKEGVKSYTFKYTTQGVECYFRSFLALLVGSSAQLSISLGTLYNINKIVFEKFNGTDYVMLQQIVNPSSLQLNFTDASLRKGLNIYRVKLELAGGRVIYSSIETVYYFNGAEFIVYPNPASQYSPITILSDNQFEPATLHVINMQGQKIYEMKLNDISNQLPVGRLSKGLNLLRITRKDQKDIVLKLFVQ